MVPDAWRVGESVHHSRETVPPAGGDHALLQAVGEALNLDRVQAHQAHVAQRARQFPRVIELHPPCAVMEALVSSSRRTGTRGST